MSNRIDPLPSALRSSEKLEDYDTVVKERDLLLSIVAGAQKREAQAERTIQLLLIAGHVAEERVAQARELARL